MPDFPKNIVVHEAFDPQLSWAVVAAGCFWCLEANFQTLEGVSGAINGYAGGQQAEPTYEQVYQQKTDHREAVLVYYDQKQISYEAILETFWRSIDPTDSGGQFFDRGFSYTTAIFYKDAAQKQAATASKAALQKFFPTTIATDILPLTNFYEAEAYHQDFYRKSPERYQDYARASGREEYKQLVWQAILSRQDKRRPD